MFGTKARIADRMWRPSFLSAAQSERLGKSPAATDSYVFASLRVYETIPAGILKAPFPETSYDARIVATKSPGFSQAHRAGRRCRRFGRHCRLRDGRPSAFIDGRALGCSLRHAADAARSYRLHRR